MLLLKNLIINKLKKYLLVDTIFLYALHQTKNIPYKNNKPNKDQLWKHMKTDK